MNNSQKKISIIVPIYKVEKYLDRCIESLVNQTYKNLEIILVDDGSSDNCPAMCDEWKTKDDRIKVIHKANGGLSEARNSGIEISTGEYIGFVDSDDFVEKEMYEQLIDKLESGYDMSMCGINYTYDDSNLMLDEINLCKLQDDFGLFYSFLILSGKKRRNNKLVTENVMCAVWRCLYKRELLKGVKFEKDLFCEDVIFTLNILEKSPKIGVVEKSLYNYYQREGSILHYYNEKKLMQREIFIKRALELLELKISKQQLEYFKFLQYELCFNEVSLSKDKELRKKFLENQFLQSLNCKNYYKVKKSMTKLLKYKIADFLVHYKMFCFYNMLVKFK